MEIKVSKDNFEQEVLNSNIPVLVDFWATWCGPCLMLSPHLEDVAKEYDGKIKIAKINVDEEMQLAIKYGVNSIPALFIFDKGIITKKSIGYLNKNELISFIEK